MVTISRLEYECLKAERDELNQKLDWLLEQAHLSRKKLCGAFSERLGEELMNRLRRMFDETEAWLSKRRDKPGQRRPPIPGAPEYPHPN